MNPGQQVSVHAGFNVRFDIYDQPLHNDMATANFAPDLNVTKGAYKSDPNKCTQSNLYGDDEPDEDDYVDTVALPRDSDVNTNINRIGTGLTQTELQDYWSVNNPTLNGGTLPIGITTRYQAYQYETANGIPNASPTGENGNPTCAPAGVPDRRRMVTAVINCIEHGIQGSENGVPVIEFMEMFLTEPASEPGGGGSQIYAEIISVVQPGGNDGILHEFPVLYR